MSGKLIDLYGPEFWAVVAGAVFLLTPLTSPSLRRRARAAVNVGFLVVLLRAEAAPVVAGLAIVWALLKLAEGRGRTAPIAVIAGATLGLFLVHKLPRSSALLGLGRLNPVLVTIGFSYLALRVYEVARAVYQKRHPAPDLIGTINYLVPFHMLASGPIQSYDEFVAEPPVPPAPTARHALVGVERIALGMFKKFVVAFVLSATSSSPTGGRAALYFFLVEMQVAFIWLYLDFSAYSDIAVGVGTLIGVPTPENFRRPYFARNIIDFWERWHISLSMFARRNIYIPIQLALVRRNGGAHPLRDASIAFVVTFAAIGLWHEFGPYYLLWGLSQALGLIVCNLYRAALQKRIGRKGVQAYLANPWIRAAMIAVTFEYAVVCNLLVMYPFRGRY